MPIPFAGNDCLRMTLLEVLFFRVPTQPSSLAFCRLLKRRASLCNIKVIHLQADRLPKTVGGSVWEEEKG